MASAQDYKRIFDQDRGPNTGGMGTYSPSLVFHETLEKEINDRILQPTLRGLQEDGLDFQGVLFIGLMITEDGPKVIEFNNRFGDPETQSVLPRMENDLLEVLLAVRNNKLGDIQLKWDPKPAVCVVLASQGYPGPYPKGDSIIGLDRVDPDILIFHAGTQEGPQGVIQTAGGRVLGVTARGKTHDEAREKAYNNLKKIHFAGMQYRQDIGLIGKEHK